MMLRITPLVCALLLASTRAFAHPSLAPHEHPHGVSPLSDLTVLVAVAAAVAVITGAILVKTFKRSGHDPR